MRLERGRRNETNDGTMTAPGGTHLTGRQWACWLWRRVAARPLEDAYRLTPNGEQGKQWRHKFPFNGSFSYKEAFVKLKISYRIGKRYKYHVRVCTSIYDTYTQSHVFFHREGTHKYFRRVLEYCTIVGNNDLLGLKLKFLWTPCGKLEFRRICNCKW